MIGLDELEFSQPMDSAPFCVGTRGWHFHRQSLPAPQRKELTRWVTGSFSKPERLDLSEIRANPAFASSKS